MSSRWDNRAMVLRIGLTGGIASGKSTVADALAAHGAVIIDADVLAREVVEPGSPGLDEVVDRFGAEVLTPQGALDRSRLAEVIFADAGAREDLNAIIHPLVRARAAELERAAAAADPTVIIVQVIPLLVETGQADRFDAVVVVDLPTEAQRTRLMARNGLSEEQADRRIAAQATRADRLAAATYVIDNAGPPEAVTEQVDALWTALVSRPSD